MSTGWHFVGAALRDGRPVPPDGEWLEHEGVVSICQSGLHASLRPWHALQYAPGPILCRVELADVVESQPDKLVARRRRIIARLDVTSELCAFARDEALRVAHLWDCPEIVRRYLETGDEAIRPAARDAAMAAGAAAWDAAWDAAMAAGAAAWDAAMAASDAARDARNAAWAAARAAAMAASDAARNAAWHAAWAAARAASGSRFDARLIALFQEAA